MPRGLKIINRANITPYNLAWTAGVDYIDENNKNNNEKEESKEQIEYSDSDSNSSDEDSLAK